MNSLRNILVAIDFSPSSADAFRQAERIAAWNLASLSAIHAVDPILCAAPFADPIIPISLPAWPDPIAAAHHDWRKFVPGSAARPLTTLAVEVGGPRPTILAAVPRTKADLLVLGCHSAHDADRGVGHVARGCMQYSPVPVLAVRLGHTGPFRGVLACVDFGATSLDVVSSALRIATQDGAALHVLHVYRDPWAGASPPERLHVNMPDFDAQYARAVEARLREFCEPIGRELGALKANFHAVPHRSGSGIIPFAERQGCDLVVLGTRGKWNVRDTFLGSTAERVAREAGCSVLAVPPRNPEAHT
ncbi:MAG: universal stress protein [Phycisphaerales bacterium]|nr:universal stress protein [Phycisphaerales bacterium]